MTSKKVTYFSLNSPEYWMEKALALAVFAAEDDEVPVGAIVVLEGEIIGEGKNSVICKHNPTAHAEIQAIQQASLKVENYRLVNADLYVTIEPCAMCAGAMVHSRIRHLYFGACEKKSGAVVSNIKLLDQASMNHVVKYSGGILEDRCSGVISEFFKRRRSEQKALRASQKNQ